MNEIIKLKLRIKIYDTKVSTLNPMKLNCCMLSIFIDDIDGRFELYKDDTALLYATKDNKFNILKTKNLTTGLLTEKYFYIPSKPHLGLEIKYCFFEDKKRKELLKKLYEYLIEWGDNWDGFSGTDYDTKIDVKEDVWEIKSCILPF